MAVELLHVLLFLFMPVPTDTSLGQVIGHRVNRIAAQGAVCAKPPHHHQAASGRNSSPLLPFPKCWWQPTGSHLCLRRHHFLDSKWYSSLLSTSISTKAHFKPATLSNQQDIFIEYCDHSFLDLLGFTVLVIVFFSLWRI